MREESKNTGAEPFILCGDVSHFMSVVCMVLGNVSQSLSFVCMVFVVVTQSVSGVW